MELTHFNYIRDGKKVEKNKEGKHDEEVTEDSPPTWHWMILFAGVFSNFLQSVVTITNSKMYLQLVERFSMHYTFLVSGSISSYMGVRYLSGKQAYIAFFVLIFHRKPLLVTFLIDQAPRPDCITIRP